MRSYLSLLFSAAFVSGCAYEGVVVQKDLQPRPMYLSHGIENKYTFILQDKSGVRRRQMVTPDVFERYAIGQYFNDQETGPSGAIDDGKSMKPAVMTASRSSAATVARYASKTSIVRAAKSIAAKKSAKRAQRLAAKAKARRNTIAAAKRKRSKAANSVVTVAHVAPVASSQPIVEVMPPEAPLRADFGIVTVARCR